MTEREKQRTEIIKKKVDIPSYFEKIIIPNMEFYYSGGVDFDSKPYCRCPIHSEDTGSFRYFDYSNSYYCYGCTSGGDIIALHRNFMLASSNEEVSFEEAINFLYERFIEGNDTTQLGARIGGRINVDEPLSTNVELARFYKFAADTEEKIRNYPESERPFYYTLLDTLEQVVKLNKVNASDARNLLKLEMEVLSKRFPVATKMRYAHVQRV